MSWPLVTIDSIKANHKYSLVGGPFGSNLSGKHYVEEGVPVIRGGNLPNHQKFSFKDFVYVTQEKADSLTQNLAYPGDVIFTQRGTLGQVGIIPSDSLHKRFVVSQSQMKLTVNTEIALAEYIYFAFSSREYKEMIKNYSITSGVPHINLGILKSMQVPLPPLAVQGSIVKVLNAYDNLIENNRRRIQLLEESARLLYKEWFVHLRFPGHEHVKIVDGVPEGWEKTTAYEVMEVLSGGTPKTKKAQYWDGDIPFFTPKDTTENAFCYSTEKMITEQGLLKCNSRLYQKYTIFITARGTVGKLTLAQRSMAMNQSCYALIGQDDVSQYFLYCSLNSSIDQFKTRASGAVFDAIVVDTFKLIPFLKPTTMLIEQFTETVSHIFNQVDNLSSTNRRLAQARDILLPRLMNGTLSA